MDEDIVTTATIAARSAGGDVSIHHERDNALKGRRLVYVKSWGPMEGASRTPESLRPWCIDEAALSPTDNGRVMHCLPVRREVVIAGEVLDSKRSLITDQAENRLWAQTALLELVAKEAGVLQ